MFLGGILLRTLKITTGAYKANCYIIYCKDTNEGIIIDPGDEPDRILDKIKNKGLKIKYIILTHGHGDHIGAVKKVMKRLNIPLLAHEDEKELLMDAAKNLSNIMVFGPTELMADKLLKDGDVIEFGNLKAEIIHTPGHTAGGICIKVGNNLITGDTIFKGSIGRTDLYSGDYRTLIKSIKNKLLLLDNKMVILPGHGEASTIGNEKVSNPFLN